MEWLSYTATVLGLTLPLAVGFVVIGVIIVGLGILGGELYTESDTEKRLRSRPKPKLRGAHHRHAHPRR